MLTTREDTARAVRAAIDRGELPRGGPSAADAFGLLETVPAGYWRRWSEVASERIRAQQRTLPALPEADQ